jgi:hypothetical protein
MPLVLQKLQEIEREVMSRGEERPQHMGSIKLSRDPGNKRPIPVFDPSLPGSCNVGRGNGWKDEEAIGAMGNRADEGADTLEGRDGQPGEESDSDATLSRWETAPWDDDIFDALDHSRAGELIPHCVEAVAYSQDTIGWSQLTWAQSPGWKADQAVKR